MVALPKAPELKRRIQWRSVLVFTLTLVGLIALTVYSATHWVERQLLTPDNWVATMAPLPSDNTVAAALSTYSVNQLFTTADLESRVATALPDRTAFLVPPITEQLQMRLTNQTQRAIQSDTFSTIWQGANRVAINRLLESARNPSPQQNGQTATFSLDLPSISQVVTSILNGHSPLGALDTITETDGRSALQFTLIYQLKKPGTIFGSLTF